jgi:hypothetical protein
MEADPVVFMGATPAEGSSCPEVDSGSSSCSPVNRHLRLGPRTSGLHLLLLHPSLLRRDATTTVLNIRVHLPPINPSTSMRARQDDDNDDALDRPSIDTCGWDPGKDDAEAGLCLRDSLCVPRLLRPSASASDAPTQGRDDDSAEH